MGALGGAPGTPAAAGQTRAHGGAAIYSPQTFGAVSLLRWQKPHCEDAAQRSSNRTLLPNPSSPKVSAQLWVPSLREPPVCADIITWNQKDEVDHWGRPFGYSALAFLLSSCSLPAALLLRWMHKSQAVGITFCCPCTCFAFSRNLPGCQSRTVAGSPFPGKLNTYILHKEIRGLALKMEYTSLRVLQTAWQYTGCEL